MLLGIASSYLIKNVIYIFLMLHLNVNTLVLCYNCRHKQKQKSIVAATKHWKNHSKVKMYEKLNTRLFTALTLNVFSCVILNYGPSLKPNNVLEVALNNKLKLSRIPTSRAIIVLTLKEYLFGIVMVTQ